MIKIPDNCYVIRLKFPDWKDLRELRVEEVDPGAKERTIYLQVTVHAEGCPQCDEREDEIRSSLRGKRTPYGTTDVEIGENLSRFYRFTVPAEGEPAEHLRALLGIPFGWSPIRWEAE